MCVCAQLRSHVQLFETPWTIAHQAPLSTEFSRQEYWSELPFLSPGAIFVSSNYFPDTYHHKTEDEIKEL